MRKILNNKGFTLIELIVVIVILGILSVVAVPKVVGAIKDSKISTVKNNLDTVVKAINTSVAQTGDIPANGAAVDALLSGKTLANMGITYCFTAGNTYYHVYYADATAAPVKLTATDVVVGNFPAGPYGIGVAPKQADGATNATGLPAAPLPVLTATSVGLFNVTPQ